MEEKRNVHRILMGKSEGRRPLRRTSHKWVYNITIDLKEIGWGGMDWIDLPQDRNQWRALEYLHNWRLLKKDSAAWS
jgi:hypothetical protein